jgi:hypothetical protein
MSADVAAFMPDGSARPVFALRKSWVDTEPGIEIVQVRYAWTVPGGRPDWDLGEEAVLQPRADVPGLRSAVVEVPRFVAGSPAYALHHFFFVIRRTGQTTMGIFTEDVVAREVSYSDETGDYTSVGVAWQGVETAPMLEVPNYTAARMDGLAFQSEGADAPGEPAAIHEFVRAQPLPHVFRALVWGLRGSQVRYSFQLLRTGSPNPADDGDRWVAGDGDGWVVAL